jgi:hypothetical protein
VLEGKTTEKRTVSEDVNDPGLAVAMHPEPYLPVSTFDGHGYSERRSAKRHTCGKIGHPPFASSDTVGPVIHIATPPARIASSEKRFVTAPELNAENLQMMTVYEVEGGGGQ